LKAAAWGGVAGRALRTGDGLNWADIAGEPRMGWSVSHDLLTTLPEGEVTLRVLRGAQANEFGAEGWRRFTGQVYGVGPDSDRMGVRLKGPVIKRESGRELLSAPVCPGAVQVPAGGQAIVLLADAQTLGGYPLLAHVISADWSRLAQLKPGDQVRFVEVTLAQAEAARQARGRELAWLRTGCRMAWGHR
jgi:antagonist of KipI